VVILLLAVLAINSACMSAARLGGVGSVLMSVVQGCSVFMNSWHAMQTPGSRYPFFFRDVRGPKQQGCSSSVLHVCLWHELGCLANMPTRWQQHGCQHSMVVRQHEISAFAFVIFHLVLWLLDSSRLQLLLPGGARLALPTAARHCNFRAAHHHSVSSTSFVVAQAHSDMFCCAICLVAAFTESSKRTYLSRPNTLTYERPLAAL
jgi:hypothetical protein